LSRIGEGAAPQVRQGRANQLGGRLVAALPAPACAAVPENHMVPPHWKQPRLEKLFGRVLVMPRGGPQGVFFPAREAPPSHLKGGPGQALHDPDRPGAAVAAAACADPREAEAPAQTMDRRGFCRPTLITTGLGPGLVIELS